MYRAPIRTVHVVWGDHSPDDEIQIFDVARALSERSDIQLRLVLMDGENAERRLRATGVPFDVVDTRKLSAAAAFMELRRLFFALRPQIIQSHHPGRHLLTILAARGMDVVHLRTIHSLAGACRTWRCEMQRWLDDFCHRFQEAGICASPEAAADLQRRMPGLFIQVVEKAIDVEEVRRLARRPADESVLGHGFRVAFVGHLSASSRPDLFLAAAHAMIRDKPGTFSFHLFGDGDLQDECRRFIHRHSLGDHVRLMGVPSNLPAFLARMHTFVICSERVEIPQALLQCMALGIPVVACARSGAAYVLGYGKYGILVREQEPSEYGAALSKLSHGSEELDAMIRSARIRAETCHTTAVVADRYMELYRALLAMPPGGRRVVYD